MSPRGLLVANDDRLRDAVVYGAVVGVDEVLEESEACFESGGELFVRSGDDANAEETLAERLAAAEKTDVVLFICEDSLARSDRSPIEVPDGRVQRRGETDPEQVGDEEPRGRGRNAHCDQYESRDEHQKQDDVDEGVTRLVKAKEEP